MTKNTPKCRQSAKPVLAERRTTVAQYRTPHAFHAKPGQKSDSVKIPEDMNDFVVGVAHDLNNLIAATAGFATLIISKPDSRSTLYAERILAASRMAGLLVQRLVQKNNASPKLQGANIPDVINEIVALMEFKTGQPAKINIEYDECIEEYDIDLTDLQQLIMNLTINARYALHSNTINPELHIRLHKADKDILNRRPDFGSVNQATAYLCLEVIDNGSGMDEATRQNLLKPYYTTKGELGTGIGLAIVSNIVSTYNGAIFIDSVKGRGTRFSILWPSVSLASRNGEPDHHGPP